MRIIKKFIVFIVSILVPVFIFGTGAQYVEAASFDLIAPTGSQTRGQNVQFTINVDTQGQSLSQTTIGLTYKTDTLQYISTTPGNTFQTVSAQTQDGGKLVFTASNPTSFSGTGTFAVVTFQLLSSAPGNSTELCVLFNPESPTQPPAPTSLPKTGSTSDTNRGIFLGGILLVIATGALVFYNHKPYKRPLHSTHRKTLH